MQIYMILALLVAILSAVFAVQNTAQVTVHFLGFTIENSLAVVLLLTFTDGCVASLCVSVPTMYLKLRKRRKETEMSEVVPSDIEVSSNESGEA